MALDFDLDVLIGRMKGWCGVQEKNRGDRSKMIIRQ
jgi:hypothetical protein